MNRRWLLDYDGTLADTFTEQIERLNARFGTDYTRANFTSWRSEDVVTAEEADFLWGANCFLDESFQAGVKPVTGAIEGVRALLEVGDHCMVVSDRPQILFDVTRSWLDAHGLDMVRLLFTHNKHSLSTDGDGMITKRQAAARHKLSHVVEDAPHHAIGLSGTKSVQQVFLIDTPHNYHVSHDKVIRVNGWDDVVRHVTGDSFYGEA